MSRAKWWMIVVGSAVLLRGVVPATAGEGAWTAPAPEKGKQNPVPRTTGVQESKKVFGMNCSIRHGPTGKGDGAAAAALNPKPKDLSAKAVLSQADGELFWKISTGRGAMPMWQTLPEKDRWAVIQYVRSLGGKKWEEERESLSTRMDGWRGGSP